MFPYEKLEVYKIAFNTNRAIYRYLKNNKSIPGYAKNQLGRAALSIMLNIAEGSAKFSSKERKTFYTTACRSVFECASLVSFLAIENDIAILFTLN
ncbi:MAG TPA: four helix bundle protein [Flavipsychrobacter sp.]|nr:four helix bundle protein [Flavipsychrobacter sp.]